MPTIRYQRRMPEQTVLYNAVREQWPVLRAMARQANVDRGLPPFIEVAAEHFIRCGDLRRGFVRAVCDRCRQSVVVAFSCKQRGICASCDGKRMTEVSAHWVDAVIPAVPVRQWVLTFPFALRYLLAWNAPLRSAVLGAFMRALQAHYRRQALAQGGQDPKYAAISIVQRFDAAVRLSLHWHILAADGAWVRTPASGLGFLPAPPLHQAEVEAVFADALRRISRQWKRLVADADDEPHDKLSQRDPALAALLRGAMLGQQSSGADAGKPQRVEFGRAVAIKPRGRNCAQAGGFSLHANTRVGELARGELEKLCRYVCRPAIAASRLEQVDPQTIRVSLKNEWSGGVTAVLLSPRDLVIRALAQIPLPRRPSIRYHGNFAPNSADRPRIVPPAGEAKCELRRQRKACPDPATVEQTSTRMSWAECQKRAFLWDVLDCPCGGRRKVVAAVQDKADVERFLRHLGLWPDPDDITVIRGPPELMEPPDDDLADRWDGVDEPQPLDWVA